MTAGKLVTVVLAGLVVIGAAVMLRSSDSEAETAEAASREVRDAAGASADEAGESGEGADGEARIFPKAGVTSILGVAGEYEFDILSGSLYADWSGRLELGPAMGHDLPWMMRHLRRAAEGPSDEEEEPPRSTTAAADSAVATSGPEPTVGWTVLLEDGLVITEFDPITEAFTPAGVYEGPVALTHIGPDWWVQLAPVEE